MYRRFGLSDRQIDIVADATPKRHYYYVSPLGRRLFQFSLGPAALAFIGAGSKDDVLAARRMIDAARRALDGRVAPRAADCTTGPSISTNSTGVSKRPQARSLSVNGIPPFHTNGKCIKRR